jgi:hypothetical protein
MRIAMETITPAKAAKYLEAVDIEHQRKLRPTTVQGYSASMKAGQWLPNHQPIAFDTAGRCIDGQHRLHACVDSGVTIQMAVARDVPEKGGNGLYTIDTVDRMAPRTVGEQLQLRHGWKNACAVAATAKLVARIIHPTSGLTCKMDVGRTLGVLDIYGKDIAHVVSVMYTGVRLFQRAAFYAALTIARHPAPDRVDTFISQLASCEGLTASSPAHTLVKWRGGDNSSDNQNILMASTCYCAMKHYLGEPLKACNRHSRQGIDFFLDMQKRDAERIRKIIGAGE